MIESFNEKWTPEPFSGCWLWMGAGTRYGVSNHRHRPQLAHRVSWEIYRGQIPSRACVLHKCDTPMCVNPDHLFLGTKRDNTRDCIHKGRWKRGKALSEQEVRNIRESTDTQVSLGRRFGVTQSAISRIKSGENHGGLEW